MAGNSFEKRADYKIMERNYRISEKARSISLPKKTAIIYFVEVRSKSNNQFGSAAESV